MDTFTAIRSRRSVKNYDATYQLTAAEVDQLVDLAMQAPSSYNIQHCRLVKVSDAQLRKKIRAIGYNQPQITDASLLFIVAADVKAWMKNPERYWRNVSKEVQERLVPTIVPFYENNEQLQRDEAMRSIGLMAQTIMLAAKAMGYDSCPMIGFEAGKVAELINLPKDCVIGMMISIGKAVQPAGPKPGFISKEEMLIENHF